MKLRVHIVGVAGECAKWALINFHKMREFSNKTEMNQIEFFYRSDRWRAQV